MKEYYEIKLHKALVMKNVIFIFLISLSVDGVAQNWVRTNNCVNRSHVPTRTYRHGAHQWIGPQYLYYYDNSTCNYQQVTNSFPLSPCSNYGRVLYTLNNGAYVRWNSWVPNWFWFGTQFLNTTTRQWVPDRRWNNGWYVTY